jgi:hypothetical protein
VHVTQPAANGVDLALVAEACKKSGMIWVQVPGSRPRAAWHVWHAGPDGEAAYVVTGDGEQELPGIENADQVLVTVRSKDKGGRLVTWLATSTRVEPGSPEWDGVVPALVGNRLNARDGDAAADRWATNARVTRLRPTGQVPEKPGQLPTDPLTAPPPPSPATTRTPVPFVFGRRAVRRH